MADRALLGILLAATLAACAQKGVPPSTTPSATAKAAPQPAEIPVSRGVKATGPLSWPARVAAAVRPNVIYPEADKLAGNAGAEFSVRLATDGTILSQTLIKSSGVPDWDMAAARALANTGRIPLDANGTVPPTILIMLRPRV